MNDSLPTSGAVLWVGISVHAKILNQYRKTIGYVPSPLQVNGIPVMLMKDKNFHPEGVFISDDFGKLYPMILEIVK